MAMELVFLGTGSAYPSPTRGASCLALRTETEGCWLFDCGEGSQTQLMKCTVRPGKITKIFISHLHGDHLFGLPGLLCTINQTTDRCHVPIDIYGPYGICRYLRTTLSLSRSFLGFQYRVHELMTGTSPSDIDGVNWNPSYEPDGVLHPNELEPRQIRPNANGVWEVCALQPFTVLASPLRHRVTTFGYVIMEDDIPGKLQVHRLKELGVPPGPLYGRLKKGENVTAPSGITITPSDVMGPPERGRKIVILGDTCDSRGIAEIAKNADILVHEATNENSHVEKCVQNGHSTPRMAAEFGLSIGAQKLILTHFSQRYKDLTADLQENEDSVEKLLKEAQEVFGTEVYVAADFKTFTVPLHRI